jgi:hypothetical protein
VKTFVYLVVKKIRGKDAKRFKEAMENIKPLPKEELEAMDKAYEWFKERAVNFRLP